MEAQVSNPTHKKRELTRKQAIAPIVTAMEVASPFLAFIEPTVGAITSAGAAIARQTLAETTEERVAALLEHIQEGCGVLDDESLHNQDVVHCLILSINAARRTRNRGKIELFARLFSGYYRSVRREDVDEFEQAHTILDDLQPRELYILVILSEAEDRGDIVNTISSDYFLGQVEKRVGIPREEIPAYLARLNRTGLYKNDWSKPVGGLVGAGGSAPEEGSLTPYFRRFREMLDLDQSAFTRTPTSQEQ